MSIRGRPTLVKSVLGSLSLYYFSMFCAPTSVINPLRGFQLGFIGKMVVAVSARRRSVVGSSDKKLVWKLGNDEGIRFGRINGRMTLLCVKDFQGSLGLRGMRMILLGIMVNEVVMGECGNWNGWVFLEGDQWRVASRDLELFGKAHNNKVFQSKEMVVVDIFFEIQLTSFFWIS
ncbi:hypothetical protein Tco_1561351 [Tanacetum coccineum]